MTAITVPATAASYADPGANCWEFPMDRLVFILDDIDDVMGLLLGGLGRPAVLAVCICTALVTGAAVIAGWRGVALASMASGLILAWLQWVARADS